MSSKRFKIIGIIIAIGGIIFGIVLGAVCQYDYSSWASSPKYTFNVGLMIQTWIIAFIISLGFWGISAILVRLEAIEEKLSGINELEKVEIPLYGSKTNPKGDEWVCPKCGKINQSYVGTCGCGEKKTK